jgi:hypothetical protein
MTALDADAQRARRGIIRSAIWTTPVFIVSAAAAVFLLSGSIGGSASLWVAFALTALLALLSGVLSLSAWRDLFAEPQDTEGYIDRKWTKSDLFVFRAHYVMVGKRVFRVRKDIYHDMPDIGDRVYLNHFPHTNALVRWRHVDTPPPREAISARDPIAVSHNPPHANPPESPSSASPPSFQPPTPREHVQPPSFRSDPRSTDADSPDTEGDQHTP